MKWIVPGPNAKVLAQAIHCLAKLGDELYIEGRPEKLSFRTVNSSKTAFASFSFRPDFFSFYPNVLTDDGPRCQVSMKAALVVFRFPSGMEKAVESCAVCLLPAEDLVEFRLKFKQGFVKTNKIQLLESEVLQASYEDEVLPSRLVMEPKVLADFLASFLSPEITWAVTANGVQFRNFSDLVDDGVGLRSEVHVCKEELLELSVTSAVELTFCLSELRTVLNFAEHVSCPLAVSFTESGKPMFFIVSNEVLTAHIVLSTLGLSASQSSTSSSVNQSQRRVSADMDQSERRISVDPSQRRDFIEPGSQPPSQTTASQQAQRFEVLKKVLRRPDYDITKLPGYDEILAPDSDEEMDV